MFYLRKIINYLIRVFWKIRYILILSLISDSCGCSLSVLFGHSIKKYQIRIHFFSKLIVLRNKSQLFASSDLTVLCSNSKLINAKLIIASNKYYWNIWFFWLPKKKSWHITLYYCQIIYCLLKLKVWRFY